MRGKIFLKPIKTYNFDQKVILFLPDQSLRIARIISHGGWIRDIELHVDGFPGETWKRDGAELYDFVMYSYEIGSLPGKEFGDYYMVDQKQWPTIIALELWSKAVWGESDNKGIAFEQAAPFSAKNSSKWDFKLSNYTVPVDTYPSGEVRGITTIVEVATIQIPEKEIDKLRIYLLLHPDSIASLLSMNKILDIG